MIIIQSLRLVKTTTCRPTLFACFSNISTETPSQSNIKRQSWASQKIKDYAELSKFKLSSLVVLTTGAGFLCAGAPVDLATMAVACSGTALCAASAGTFNQVIEIDRDKKMNRTKNRPLPAGRITKLAASSWGCFTGITGVGMLLAGVNPVVAALGATNIIVYAGAYTLSKPYSEMNTWIGSIVGAIPPVMGWAAATGGVILAPEPIALSTLLFLWQFPHFFSLSWMHREDYTRGGFEMVAVNDPHGNRSADLIWEYSLYMACVPFVTSMAGLTSCMFAIEGAAINAYLLYLARKFQKEQTNSNARRIFLCSLWYLPVLLGAFVFHSHTWNTEESKNENKIGQFMANAKETMKGLCLHEIISNNESSSSPQLCPKVVAEKAIENSEPIHISIEQNKTSINSLAPDKDI